jgi:hypothetical protein
MPAIATRGCPAATTPWVPETTGRVVARSAAWCSMSRLGPAGRLTAAAYRVRGKPGQALTEASEERAFDEQDHPHQQDHQRRARHRAAFPLRLPDKEQEGQADRHHQGLAHLDARVEPEE